MNNLPGTQDRDYSAGYKRFVLVMLTLVYAFNFIDRQILVILQEPIKADMGLSDAQLGLLSGFTFALIYATAGIPIAYWADRGNRRNIICMALTVWSGMTALSGLAANYGQLLLARLGVGLGEAGGSPPAHSMISDYFRPENRGTALSFYSTGIYIGILLGFMFGGVIAEAFGWRMAFFIVGVPGVVFAIILRLHADHGADQVIGSRDVLSGRALPARRFGRVRIRFRSCLQHPVMPRVRAIHFYSQFQWLAIDIKCRHLPIQFCKFELLLWRLCRPPPGNGLYERPLHSPGCRHGDAGKIASPISTRVLKIHGT